MTQEHTITPTPPSIIVKPKQPPPSSSSPSPSSSNPNPNPSPPIINNNTQVPAAGGSTQRPAHHSSGKTIYGIQHWHNLDLVGGYGSTDPDPVGKPAMSPQHPHRTVSAGRPSQPHRSGRYQRRPIRSAQRSSFSRIQGHPDPHRPSTSASPQQVAPVRSRSSSSVARRRAHAANIGQVLGREEGSPRRHDQGGKEPDHGMEEIPFTTARTPRRFGLKQFPDRMQSDLYHTRRNNDDREKEGKPMTAQGRINGRQSRRREPSLSGTTLRQGRESCAPPMIGEHSGRRCRTSYRPGNHSDVLRYRHSHGVSPRDESAAFKDRYISQRLYQYLLQESHKMNRYF
eukprot:gb/GECH01001694.1/.p1 GENE.gb/GECH01001694.1/~~gb/GECH01001694.1/.p1  ORF type:complete len:342 (+),score=67.17 gb/GECH01001694.1/:1-1026(+)